MGYIKSGRFMTIWGVVTQDAKLRQFDSGKCKTSFSMRYDQERDEDGNKISKYMEIEAWAELAKYAAGLERGDVIHVDGEFMRDNYLSEKKGEERHKVVADTIFVQPFAESAEEYEEAPASHPVSRQTDPSNAFKESAEEDDGELPF